MTLFLVKWTLKWKQFKNVVPTLKLQSCRPWRMHSKKHGPCRVHNCCLSLQRACSTLDRTPSICWWIKLFWLMQMMHPQRALFQSTGYISMHRLHDFCFAWSVMTVQRYFTSMQANAKWGSFYVYLIHGCGFFMLLPRPTGMWSSRRRKVRRAKRNRVSGGCLVACLIYMAGQGAVVQRNWQISLHKQWQKRLHGVRRSGVLIPLLIPKMNARHSDVA